MNISKLEDNIEFLAAKVHDSWWEEKSKQGFHSPLECKSSNKKHFYNSDWKAQDRFYDHFEPKYYEWCEKCHPNMYPYEELSENVKEYDRVTVETVLNAIKEL